MASRILARVSERTRGSLLITLDTVFGDTLARSATSWIVTDAGLKLMAKENLLETCAYISDSRGWRAPKTPQVVLRTAGRGARALVDEARLRDGQPKSMGGLDGRRHLDLGEVRAPIGKTGQRDRQGLPAPRRGALEDSSHIQHGTAARAAQRLSAAHADLDASRGNPIDAVAHIELIPLLGPMPEILRTPGNPQHAALTRPIGADAVGAGGCDHRAVRALLAHCRQMNLRAVIGDEDRPWRDHMPRVK